MTGAIHSTEISGNFRPKLNGSLRSNRKSVEKTGPPFEVDHFSRSERSEFWLNGSRLMSGERLQKFHTDDVSQPRSGSASDWLCRVGNLLRPIRSTTQMCAVTRHQYGISALVSQTSFCGETGGGVGKCRLFFSGYGQESESTFFSHLYRARVGRR